MIPGLTIGGLFALTRRAAREEQLEEIRRHTEDIANTGRRRLEQSRSLSRMRSISEAQLVNALVERGIPLAALAGHRLETDSPAASSYIAQAGQLRGRTHGS
jgi:hypothetical protein